MKIPQKFMGLLGKFADSLDYKDLPKDWADNPEIVQAAEELYRGMGTESPFFKAWFGKSKVVDESGKPLKAYHGTNAEFDTFRNSKSGTFGPASYFTPDKDIALQYANGHDGSNLKEVFLKSDNPYSMQDTTQAPEQFWDVFDAGNDEKTINNFLAHGYDSAWAKGKAKTAFGETSPEIAVYSPEQIKSTSNRGTFNPSDPNIYKALPWAVGGTAAGTAMMPDGAQAAIPADKYPWPAKQKGYVNREPGLKAPVVDPADIMTAPIGAATAGGKMAAMAAEPFLAYGMDKAGNWLGDKIGGLLGYFGWGE